MSYNHFVACNNVIEESKHNLWHFPLQCVCRDWFKYRGIWCFCHLHYKDRLRTLDYIKTICIICYILLYNWCTADSCGWTTFQMYVLYNKWRSLSVNFNINTTSKLWYWNLPCPILVLLTVLILLSHPVYSTHPKHLSRTNYMYLNHDTIFAITTQLWNKFKKITLRYC